MPSRFDDRGISPVVGVVLMFAIVVALAATTTVLVLGFGDTLESPPPFVASEQSIEVEIGGNETRHTLEFVHRGGESVDIDALSVVIGEGDSQTRVPLSELDAGAFADGTWAAGEQLDVELDESTVCDADTGEVSVDITHNGGGGGYILSSRTIPVERGGFVIDGSRVEATTDYTANVKFVGTGWSSETADPPVNVSVHLGGERVHAWTAQNDTDEVVGSYGISRQDPETDVEIQAAGAQPEYDCNLLGFDCEFVGYTWTHVSSTENSDNVRVYRDGDEAPSFSSGEGQQSAAAYVDPYIDNGEVTLDDNQAVYLFEFNEGADRDYQDAVVLVSFFTQHEEVGVYESKAEDVILCPTETMSANPNGAGDGGNDSENGSDGND
ncbi:type IV pilin [Halorubrum tebenquichense]|nr:type IV pilin N-terminal domain-containing protein [Halorubrum tebenquichense]